MTNIYFTLFFCLGIILNLGLIYLSYWLVARKLSSRGSMLKASLVVALVAGCVAFASKWFAEYIPAGCDLITAVLLIYHCGRSMMKIERKKAILAACTFFGITLLLGIIAGIVLVACMQPQS